MTPIAQTIEIEPAVQAARHAARPAQSSEQARQNLVSRLTDLARGYQRILAKTPRNSEALTGISLVALASRQVEAAVQMARAAVAAGPDTIPAWVALGQALKADHKPEEAAEAYRQAICRDGMNALARVGMGELYLADGRSEEALREFELTLRKKPAMVTAHVGMGNALALMSRNEEALACYGRALSLQKRLPEAEYATGFVLARMGRRKEAEVHYRRALNQRRDFAAAWVGLGTILREQGRDLWAEAALERAVQLRPDMLSGWLNLAAVERDKHQPEKAEECLRKAYDLNPEQVETLVAWCQFRAGEKDLPGAWEWLNKALERAPDDAEAVNMHGILLHGEQRFAEAVEVFKRAEELGSRPASSNRGNSLLDLGRMDEALAAHERAVERDPEHPGARYNLALTRLRMGDWKRGWPDYESRWDFREVHKQPRYFRKPRWQGEPLEGRRILLHAEQGLGDTIQFSRYAALVAARDGRPILEVQKPVERLLHSLAPVRAGLADIALLGEEHPPFDLECPLMSMPAVFGTTTETAPWSGAYLGADPEAVEERLRLFPSVRPGPRVGFAWAGNPRYRADSHRSTEISTMLPLLRIPGINWISLQKGEPAQQLLDLPSDVFVWDAGSQDRDLADAAALVATLDMVVTTDTCIVHLAGAMGKPVWVLLPYLSDWRWMQEIPTTPWYPTARLLRQSSPGDWQELVRRTGEELEQEYAPLAIAV